MRKSILVVDDDLFIRNIANHMLGVDNDVLLAKNTSSARTYLSQREIDLIILDIHFKNETCKDLFKDLKQNKSSEDVPIIIFSGTQDAEMKKYLLSKGVADFIQKPYNFHDLENRINRVFHIDQKRKKLNKRGWSKAFKNLEYFFWG